MVGTPIKPDESSEEGLIHKTNLVKSFSETFKMHRSTYKMISAPSLARKTSEKCFRHSISILDKKVSLCSGS